MRRKVTTVMNTSILITACPKRLNCVTNSKSAAQVTLQALWTSSLAASPMTLTDCSNTSTDLFTARLQTDDQHQPTQTIRSPLPHTHTHAHMPNTVLCQGMACLNTCSKLTLEMVSNDFFNEAFVDFTIARRGLSGDWLQAVTNSNMVLKSLFAHVFCTC